MTFLLCFLTTPLPHLCSIKEPGIQTPDKMVVLRHLSAVFSACLDSVTGLLTSPFHRRGLQVTEELYHWSKFTQL